MEDAGRMQEFAGRDNRSVLVYRDKLFLASESFIPRAYLSFSELEPVYVGYGDSEGPRGAKAVRLQDYARFGPASEIAFKQLGNPPASAAAQLAKLNPAVMHAHFGKSGVYAMPLARALGLPLVVTFHGGDATKEIHYRASPWRVYNRRRHKLFEQAASILAVSSFIRDRLIARGVPAGRVRVHYNGVDRDRYATGEKRKEILFAGRMVEKKGIDTLAAALVKAGEALDGWMVRLLGDGPLRGQAEQLLGPVTGARVVFEGWIPADRVASYLEQAAAVVVPSRTAKSGDSEGLPMIALEGMMSGCAVVGSDHAGIPEAIVDQVTGLVFPEGDAEALAEALVRICQDAGMRAGMGEAGRQRALDTFCLQTQSARLEEHLLDVIETRGTAQVEA